MRQYQAFWDKLKVEKSLQIVTKREMHKRVVQAIKKEKAQDLVYRFGLEDRKVRERMQVGSIDDTIFIQLIECEV